MNSLHIKFEVSSQSAFLPSSLVKRVGELIEKIENTVVANSYFQMLSLLEQHKTKDLALLRLSFAVYTLARTKDDPAASLVPKVIKICDFPPKDLPLAQAEKMASHGHVDLEKSYLLNHFIFLNAFQSLKTEFTSSELDFISRCASKTM
ncbi:MAG: hypothetical protein KGJ02_05960 [Verrucomicrobiota bacterium]|nr:hypothetical protein [Verrucomicrobiota bacterium]